MLNNTRKKYTTGEVAKITGMTSQGSWNRNKRYKEGKITEEQLLQPSTHNLPGVTASRISERAGISMAAAYSRFKKYKADIMTEEQAYAKPTRKGESKYNQSTTKKGEVWTVERLREECFISEMTARKRIYKHARNEIGDRQLELIDEDRRPFECNIPEPTELDKIYGWSN